MGKVIFTADDYGAIPSIDRGIISAVKTGQINSVAAFSNSKHSINSVQNLLRISGNLGIDVEMGCHLTITSGKPLTKGLRSWVSKNGHFRKFSNHRRDNSVSRVCQINNLKSELRAQVDAFQNKGIKVKHLSSHHGSLTWFEDYLDAYIAIGKEFEIPIRSPYMVPKEDNNKYLKILNLLLIGNLKDGYKREFNAFRRNYYPHLEQILAPRNRQPTLCTNSSHYGPIPHLPLGKDVIKSVAVDKCSKLIEAVSELANSDDRVEFIFHLLDDNYDKLKRFKKESKRGKFKYDGIDRKYFDSRLIEVKSLQAFNLPDKVDFTSWKT